MSVVDRYETPTREVRLITASAAQRIADAKARLQGAIATESDGLRSEIPGLTRAVQEAEAEADQEALIFEFRALSAQELEELKLAHPPTEEGFEFDVQTFPPALLAASCIRAGDDDGLSVEEAIRLWATFSDGDCGILYGAAWGVATTANLRPFSASGIANQARSSAPNSTTAPPEESPTASS